MTELAHLYGNEAFGNYEKEEYENAVSSSQQMPTKSGGNRQAELDIREQASAPRVKETFQEYAPVVQMPPQPVQQANYKKNNSSYSFWDRLSIKRPEVMKLAIFSLVILLAIALERLCTHYLGKYLSENVFTPIQEFMLRLSYPVIIFLLLWIMKAL